jgi:hypothetical protein
MFLIFVCKRNVLTEVRTSFGRRRESQAEGQNMEMTEILSS